MTAACERVRVWYERLIAEPARRAGATRRERRTGEETAE